MSEENWKLKLQQNFGSAPAERSGDGALDQLAEEVSTIRVSVWVNGKSEK